MNIDGECLPVYRRRWMDREEWMEEVKGRLIIMSSWWLFTCVIICSPVITPLTHFPNHFILSFQARLSPGFTVLFGKEWKREVPGAKKAVVELLLLFCCVVESIELHCLHVFELVLQAGRKEWRQTGRKRKDWRAWRLRESNDVSRGKCREMTGKTEIELTTGNQKLAAWKMIHLIFVLYCMVEGRCVYECILLRVSALHMT